MKELKDIVKAYREATARQLETALATVVKVEGSSYRQPGARMLVTEEGDMTGAISGGCLEGDALRKALLAINQRKNKLITYDTREDGNHELAIQLGCNGVVHILFEYIEAGKPDHPVVFLEKLLEERREAVLVTQYSLDRSQPQTGTLMLYGKHRVILGDHVAIASLLPRAVSVAANRKTRVEKLGEEASGQEVLLEFLPPPVSLVIAGAGNDVQPLVRAAGLLGWDITVADGRASHATIQRFPEAKSVILTRADELTEKILVDSSTVFALMTHNYRYDLTLLKLLLPSATPYIGVLGPKSKLDRMLSELGEEGILITDEQLERVYGPVGLDIGAETSEEIAISVLAEIKAVLSGKKGGALRNKKGRIHSDAAATL